MSQSSFSSIDYAGEVVNNRWRVNEQIGCGGFGVIHRATDIFGRHSSVAIKFAESAEENEFEQAQTCLATEYRTLRYLNSEAPSLRVPTVYDHGRYNDTHYLVMKKLGISVQKWFDQRRQPISNSKILHIWNQVYEIIRGMHEKNLVHGDVTLGNILFGGGQTDRHDLYLIDFGSCVSHFREGAIDDLAELNDCMMKMFRNSSMGLVPDNERWSIFYGFLSSSQKETIYRNLERAYRIRERHGMPIPPTVRTVIRMVTEGGTINYSHLGRLLRQAIAHSRSQRR